MCNPIIDLDIIFIAKKESTRTHVFNLLRNLIINNCSSLNEASLCRNVHGFDWSFLQAHAHDLVDCAQSEPARPVPRRAAAAPAVNKPLHAMHSLN